GMSLESRLNTVRKNLEEAANQSGRKSDSVKLLAVSKTFSPALVREAYDLGIRDFGENYVQEAVEKKQILQKGGANINWHFIGQLQTNKVKFIVNQFDLIHSVDRLKLAEEISKRATAAQNILVEINLAGENSKGGVSPKDLP